MPLACTPARIQAAQLWHQGWRPSYKQVAEDCRRAGAARVECAPADMLDAASVDALAHRYESRVDILVNNAGMHSLCLSRLL